MSGVAGCRGCAGTTTLSSAWPNCSLTYCWVRAAKGVNEALDWERGQWAVGMAEIGGRSRRGGAAAVRESDAREVLAKGRKLVHGCDRAWRKRLEARAGCRRVVLVIRDGTGRCARACELLTSVLKRQGRICPSSLSRPAARHFLLAPNVTSSVYPASKPSSPSAQLTRFCALQPLLSPSHNFESDPTYIICSRPLYLALPPCCLAIGRRKVRNAHGKHILKGKECPHVFQHGRFVRS